MILGKISPRKRNTPRKIVMFFSWTFAALDAILGSNAPTCAQEEHRCVCTLTVLRRAEKKDKKYECPQWYFEYQHLEASC